MKKMTQVLGLILAGIAGMASAATIYVDAAATGASSGSSWADAYTSIQMAVDSAAFTSTSDATILVASGTYNELVTLAADNGGASGAPNRIMAAPGDSVIIDGGGLRANGLNIVGAANVLVDGVQVRGTTGSGFQLDGASNCALSNVVATACASGITVKDSPWLKMDNASFSGNTGVGMILDNSDDCRFDYVDVIGNGGSGVSGLENHTCDRTRFNHCVFARNNGQAFTLSGGVLKDTVWDHCSFVANRGRAFGWDWNNNNMRVTNSIVAYNRLTPAGGNGDYFRIGGSLVWGNGGTLAAGMIAGGITEAAPGFVSLFNNDYRIYPDSPALGSAADGSNLGADRGVAALAATANTFYVAADGSDAANGLTPATAFATLSRASDLALPGDTVNVAAGVYTGAWVWAANGSTTKPIAINASGVDIMSTNGIPLTITGGYFLMDGIAVTNSPGYGIELSYAFESKIKNSSAYNSANSGVRLFDAPSISFESCSIRHGGGNGLDIFGSPCTLMDRCIVFDKGTAVYVRGGEDSTATGRTQVRQCLLYGNRGNGVYLGSDNPELEVENCVVYGNSGHGFTGKDWGRNSATLRNTIFMGNNYGIHKNGGITLVEQNCDVYGNTQNYVNILASPTSISADPLFINASTGNFRLVQGSPCVDAGVNQDWMASAVDPDGKPRIVGTAVDINAYERATIWDNPYVETLDAAQITSSSATLGGELVSTGIASTVVSLYWGLSDGGDDAGAWDNVNTWPAPQSPGLFAYQVSGLSPDKTYFYRYVAQNAVGQGLGAATRSFITGGIEINWVSDGYEETLAPGILRVTRPGTATGDALVVSYAQTGGTAQPGVDFEPLPGSVTIPAGEAYADIAITPLKNLPLEVDTTVTLTLTGSQAIIAAASNATLTIITYTPPPVTELYVDAAAAAGGDGLSWGTAYKTIQEGLADAAFQISDGMSVHVAGGTYSGAIAVGPGHSGSSDKPNRIVAKAGAAPVLNLSGTPGDGISLGGVTNFVVDGIEVRNATGSGFLLNGAQACALSNVVATACANGVSVKNSNGFNVRKSSFSGNSGTGMVLDSSDDCRFDYVDVNRNGGGGVAGLPGTVCDRTRFNHCVFARNNGHAFSFAGAALKDTVWNHCSFVGSRQRALSWDWNNNNMLITNSIVAYNCETPAQGNGPYLKIAGSLVWANGPNLGNTGVVGQNVYATPGFASLINDDYRIFADSPAIAAAADGTNLGADRGVVTLPIPSIAYYVAPDGSDAADGLTPATAFATLSRASDFAEPGDTVNVAAGIYTIGWTWSASGSPTKPIVINAAGATLTPTGGAALALSGGYVEINGLTIADSPGFGMDFQYAFESSIKNCTISGSSNSGANLWLSPVITFEKCLIADGKTKGVDMIGGPNATLDRCVISGNAGTAVNVRGRNYPEEGGSFSPYTANTLVRQCLLHGNGGNGTYLGASSPNMVVESSVVYGNTGHGFTGKSWGGQSITFRNTVIMANNIGIERTGAGVSITEQNCDVYGNTVNYSSLITPSPTSISADPKFRSPATGNFTIGADSPCIDAGLYQDWMASATDLAVNPRISGGIVDIGAYEVGGGTLIVVR